MMPRAVAIATHRLNRVALFPSRSGIRDYWGEGAASGDDVVVRALEGAEGFPPTRKEEDYGQAASQETVSKRASHRDDWVRGLAFILRLARIIHRGSLGQSLEAQKSLEALIGRYAGGLKSIASRVYGLATAAIASILGYSAPRPSLRSCLPVPSPFRRAGLSVVRWTFYTPDEQLRLDLV